MEKADDIEPYPQPQHRCKTCGMRVGCHSIEEGYRCGLSDIDELNQYWRDYATGNKVSWKEYKKFHNCKKCYLNYLDGKGVCADHMQPEEQE